MSQVVTQIRDAVRQKLQDAALTPALETLVLYDYVYGLKDLAENAGRMIVRPQTIIPQLWTRGTQQGTEVWIDVVVVYKYPVAGPTAAILDPYAQLMESIVDLFLGQTLDNFEIGGKAINAGCLEAKFPHGLFIDKHFQEFRCFTSVVSLRFLVG